MSMITTRRRFLAGLGSLFTAAALGCGTVLHPERRGQAAGPLDWKIVGLDAIGLLFFFVPGVVAFAVDFSNGTIYLPDEQYGTADRSEELQEFKVPPAHLTDSHIEQVVSAHVGRPFRLSADEHQTRELQSVDEFWETDRSFRDA